ncbi:MarR family winged helix-turn-helix transcriptional regulator [Pseudonocardia halophobica]|uniref:MarR family winged helix-turn-helix transcriptional regulator n=1 Tax=Pseudonocardia halophobica TaxID=29401 RepID=UPI003D948E43
MPESVVQPVRPDPAMVTAHEMADMIDAVLAERYAGLDSRALRLSTNLKRLLTLLGHRETEAVHEPYACPAAGFRVLAMLWIFGDMSTRDICKLSAVSRQALAGVLATLEKRGLVERDRATSADRRQYTVRITDRGVDLIGPGLLAQNEVHSRFFSVLDADEQRQLSTLLAKVVGGQAQPVAGF